MKVIFYSLMPFAWTHGGLQVQIRQTWEALRQAGLEMDYLRWWDDRQTADVLHFFGRMPPYLLLLAHQRGMKVVITELLGGQGARPPWQLRLQRMALRVLERGVPARLAASLSWQSYRQADACVAVTPWEKELFEQLYAVASGRVSVIANGVEEVFLHSEPVPRESWLVSVATIREVKRTVELAQAAIASQTPLWFIGRPYSSADPYAQRFARLAQTHPQWVRYEGAIEDRTRLARVYRAARGFVLLSQYESLSLSALEAAAGECPLLLSDLPWARTTFGTRATYCSAAASTRQTARCLRQFYEQAPSLPLPPKPLSWQQVADRLAGLYRAL